MDRDPVIDEWLRSTRLGENELYLHSDQLTGLLLASDGGASPPDEVLQAWYQALARHRRTLAQSEPAFVREARARGWSWQTIADVLGLPDAEAAERYGDVLAAGLDRTDPRTNPQPWLPLGDPRVP